MKHLKKFESITDQMKPKTDEEIQNSIKNMGAYDLLVTALYTLHDLNLVEEALKKHPIISKSFIMDLILEDFHNDVIYDDANGYGIENIEANGGLFYGHIINGNSDIVEDSPEALELYTFYKKALTLIMNNNKVLEDFSAIELLGIKEIIKSQN